MCRVRMIMGQEAEAAEVLTELDARGDIDSLADYLSYAHFRRASVSEPDENARDARYRATGTKNNTVPSAVCDITTAIDLSGRRQAPGVASTKQMINPILSMLYGIFDVGSRASRNPHPYA